MTKDELVAKIAHATKMPKTHVNKMLKATATQINKGTKMGSKVSFVGFGTFTIAKKVARTDYIQQFKPSLKLFEAVSKRKPKRSKIYFDENNETIGFGKTYGESSFNNVPVRKGSFGDFLEGKVGKLPDIKEE